MPFILKSDDTIGCIFIKWRGTFSAEEGFAQYREVGQLAGYQQGAHLFHDARLVDFNVPDSEIRKVAQPPPPQANSNVVRKVATLVSSDLGFGMMRVLSAIRERHGLELRVFRDLEEAKAWLGLPADIGDPFEDMEWD